MTLIFTCTGTEMYAYVPIPAGYKATKVKIYGPANRPFQVMGGIISSATATLKGEVIS